jgi:hypothetical protein
MLSAAQKVSGWGGASFAINKRMQGPQWLLTRSRARRAPHFSHLLVGICTVVPFLPTT